MKKSILSLAVLLTACSAPASALTLTGPEKEMATVAYESANTHCRDNANYVSCNARALIGEYLVKNNVCFETRSANHRQAWRACTAEEKKLFDMRGQWFEEGGPAVSAKLTPAYLKRRYYFGGVTADAFTGAACPTQAGADNFVTTESLYGNFIYANGQPQMLVLPWTSNVVLVVLENDEEAAPTDGKYTYTLVELC